MNKKIENLKRLWDVGRFFGTGEELIMRVKAMVIAQEMIDRAEARLKKMETRRFANGFQECENTK